MKNKIRLALVCAGMLAAGICYLAGGHRTERTQIIASSGPEDFAVSESEEFKETSEAGRESFPAEETAAKLVVHVCGEVVSPGVYELDAGSRIYQAVEMAGGYTPDAAEDFLNMAQAITDGMKLDIPNREEAASSGQEAAGLSGQPAGLSAQTAGKVNINTAAKEELMTLKGIGEARAEDIISYRQLNGPFARIEDIMKVSGIKEAAFQKIRENITV